MHHGHKVCVLSRNWFRSRHVVFVVNKTPWQVQPKVYFYDKRFPQTSSSSETGRCPSKDRWLASTPLYTCWSRIISFEFWFRILVQLILRISDFLFAPHRLERICRRESLSIHLSKESSISLYHSLLAAVLRVLVSSTFHIDCCILLTRQK